MISIVVPVYNVSQYLDECLISIAAQSYIDWECILVDDGSKDDSGAICDQWALKDSRFKVIHQSNQGVSVARNNGIRAARGEYLCFIDSDDWVDLGYLQHLYDHIGTAEIAVSGIVQEYNGNHGTMTMPSMTKVFALEPSSIHDFVDLNRDFLLYGPVQKLYRRDIISKYDIHFPLGCAYGEDLQFNYAYLEHVKNIAQVAVCDYHYRIIGNGTLSSKLRTNQFCQDYEQWLLLRDFYIRHNLWLEPSRELLYKRLWGTVYDGLFLFPKLKDKGILYLQQILAIPEIDDLKQYDFACASWIRQAILSRQAWVFYLFFKFKK